MPKLLLVPAKKKTGFVRPLYPQSYSLPTAPKGDLLPAKGAADVKMSSVVNLAATDVKLGEDRSFRTERLGWDLDEVTTPVDNETRCC